MATQTFDYKGLKCPQPTLKLTMNAIKAPKGDILEVVADCPAFEKDVRLWCGNMKKPLLWIKEEGNGAKRCQIQL
jgi:tRNA 2-thiouridine synthesizing protein A